MTRQRNKEIVIATISLIVLMITGGVFFYSQEPTEKVKEEMERLKIEIQMCEQYEESLIFTIDKLALQKRLKEKEVEVYNIQISQLEKNIGEMSDTIKKLGEEIALSEEYINRRVVMAYKMGIMGYYKMLLYPEDSAMLVKSYQFISILSKKDIKLMEEYKEKKGRLEQERTRLVQEQKALAKARQGIEYARYDLAKRTKEKKLLLDRIAEQKDMYLKAVHELQISAKKLENFIGELQDKKEYFESFPEIKVFKGILPWPARGKVIKPFGKQRHAKFNTYIYNKGIELQVREGQEVKAVFDGKIVFTDWFQGYGKMVIIEHKGHVFTIYAHNSVIKVKPGDIVHGGETVAISGSTGSLEGDSLYFEIRDGIEPEDPLKWLTKLSDVVQKEYN